MLTFLDLLSVCIKCVYVSFFLFGGKIGPVCHLICSVVFYYEPRPCVKDISSPRNKINASICRCGRVLLCTNSYTADL